MAKTTLPVDATARLTAPPDPNIAGVPRNVFMLSIVSCFADISGEMIYPLIPIFLTSVLGAPVAVVGLIEGIAESTASIVKVFSGWWSDRTKRRKPLVIGGYGLAAVGKLLLAVAFVWPMALVARFVDRFGKGMRGSPRDALIADSALESQRGRAFGFHRSMDTLGAVIGPLLGLLLVALLHNRLRLVFTIAIIPGLVSVAALALVREPCPKAAKKTSPPKITLAGLDPRFRLFLLASLIFALGNSSDVFLILRAKQLGLSTTAVVLAYVLYNFVYMGAALPAGIRSDKGSRRGVLVIGLLIFAAVYAGFALVTRSVFVWPLFAVYGLYIALTDGVTKALIVDLVPADRRATAIGTYGTVTGVAALIASIVAGLLWDRVSTSAPFILGAVGALVGAILLFLVLPRPKAGNLHAT
ncbi:MAG: MFS transporter [Thermomicrobiales bacterium]